MQGPRVPAPTYQPQTGKARPEDSSRLKAIEDRVNQKYGSFGDAPDYEEAERRVLADSFFKPTVRIVSSRPATHQAVATAARAPTDAATAGATHGRVGAAAAVLVAVGTARSSVVVAMTASSRSMEYHYAS